MTDRPNWYQQWQFTLKELRETLRDRRTIITLLIMPVMLYPLLGMVMRFVSIQKSELEKPSYLIAFDSEKEMEWFRPRFQLSNELISENDSSESIKDEIQISMVVIDSSKPTGLERAIRNHDAELGLRIRLADEKSPADHAVSQVEIIQLEGSPRSRKAAEMIRERLNLVKDAEVVRNVRKLDSNYRLPIQQEIKIVRPITQESGILQLLPLILLLMTVTGGVYPAIDLTAGERERDTLETLMTLPVPRFRLLVAKFFAVVTVTMLTGFMNILAMSVTVYALQLENLLFGESGLTLVLGFKLFVVLSVFALFYSAVLLVLTSSARSFKEAQAYLIPLLLLSIGPGIVVFLPDWRLNTFTSILPLINMLLLAKELFDGTALFLPMMAALFSTLLYGVAALSFAARIFGEDAFAVGSREQWADLLKRPDDVSRIPSFSIVVRTLALLFPIYFLASGILGGMKIESMSNRLTISSLLTFVLFIVIPLSVLSWNRVAVLAGFRIQAPTLLSLFGVIVLGLGTWPIVFEMVVWLHNAGFRTFDASKIEQVEQILAAWKEIPLPVIIVCLGVVPGVCEEIFFRGFLFAGLKRQLGGWGTIIATAIAFGLFHIILSGGAAPERVVPSTVLGLILGWVAWKSNSVLPSMLMHVIHNSSLLTVAHSRDHLSQWQLGMAEQEHLPITWVIGSIVAIVVGLMLVQFGNRNCSIEIETIDQTE